MHLFQRGGQLVLFDGLEKIVARAVFERALRVFKVAVAADDDEFQRRVKLAGAADQFNSITAGHTDIGDHQVGTTRFNQLERLQAVVRNADDLHIHGGPIHQLLNQQADLLLIVRDDNSHHSRSLLSAARQCSNSSDSTAAQSRW